MQIAKWNDLKTKSDAIYLKEFKCNSAKNGLKWEHIWLLTMSRVSDFTRNIEHSIRSSKHKENGKLNEVCTSVCPCVKYPMNLHRFCFLLFHFDSFFFVFLLQFTFRFIAFKGFLPFSDLASGWMSTSTRK